MGPITVLTGLYLTILGVLGLAGRRPLPVVPGREAALATLPFGLLLVVLGLIIWGSS